MDPLTMNPFAVLTFIAAPAILTNASSVMALGTSNRFARTVERARSLAKDLSASEPPAPRFLALRTRQLQFANRRALLLVRALTAFYVSLGAFAGASLTSLLGAVFVIVNHDAMRMTGMTVAFICGTIGIAGLITGAGILVYESRLAYAILLEETKVLVEDISQARDH
jgi:hypothetical protein